jgi:WD40 repeat protein
VNDQQVGCVWQDGIIVSVGLQGTIFLLDENVTDKPKKALLGHNKIISALSYSASASRAYTADVSGYVVEWDPATGDTRSFKGAPHTSQIKQMITNKGKLISVAIDDSIKFSALDSLEFGESVPLGGQPVGVDSHGDHTVVATSEGIVVLKGSQIVHKLKVAYQAASIAMSHDGSQVAVGGKDFKVYIYQLDGSGSLKEVRSLEGHRGEVTALAFSPDGRYLGAGDSNREVKVWEGTESKVTGWVFHTSRIQSLAWAPDNNHIVTGSVDSAVIVWNVADPSKKIHVKLAHLGGVRGAVFTTANSVLSVGEDCAMKMWDINY